MPPTAAADIGGKRDGWRDNIKVHPAADLFPMISEAELRELGEDIKANGLRNRIVFWGERLGSEAFLLDGRNRLAAMEMVGLPTTNLNRTTVYGGEGVDPYAYVISANILRRHLNVEQRQNLLIEVIARSPQKSDRQLGKEIGVDHKTIASARARGENVGSIAHVKTRIDTKGRQQPAKKKRRTPRISSGISPRSRRRNRGYLSLAPPKNAPAGFLQVRFFRKVWSDKAKPTARFLPSDCSRMIPPERGGCSKPSCWTTAAFAKSPQS